MVSLENESLSIQDPFLKKALTLAVDGTDLQEIRNMMQLDMDISDSRAQAEAKVFECGGGYSPTIGIIGAVMGLIQVMKNLANIEEVGHGIAVAFVATVYGVGLGQHLAAAGRRQNQIPNRARHGAEGTEARGRHRDRGRVEPEIDSQQIGCLSIRCPGARQRGQGEKGVRRRRPRPRKELTAPTTTMARKKKQEEPVNHERWLVSYADFITLLFAFFVVMFATSQVDKSKAQAVSDSVKKALDGEPSFNAMVKVILGGTIDHTGAGNAQRKGPGGDKRIAKPDLKKTPPLAVEFCPRSKF